MQFKDLTIVSALRGLEQKEFSREELVEESQTRIEELEPSLKAFLTVQRIEPTGKGALSGIPCGIKDLLTTKGVRTTAGSRMLERYVPEYDATAVVKLKDAGAVVMGKTNCDEFALGSSTEQSAFFPTHNPYDVSRVPGGTSGGSAAAVASGEVLFALGSDTGGSVRQPASLCGCVGYKPTYGRISRYGLIAAASSLDHVGVLSKTCEDAEFVLKVIEGKDELDATSKNMEHGTWNMEQKKNSQKPLEDLKFGVVREYMESEGLDPDVQKGIQNVVNHIQGLGGEIVEASLPHARYALPCYYIINFSEVSSNLARFDGIRYGRRSQQKDLTETYVRSRTEGLGDEAKRRIMLGTFALSAGYFDQYYKQALRMRAKVREDYRSAFENVDFLVTPTTTSVAFKFGQKLSDPMQMYLEDIFTVSLNLAGIPGVSIPAGWKTVDGKHLPFGFQLIAAWGRDYEMLAVGSILEQTLNVLPDLLR